MPNGTVPVGSNSGSTCGTVGAGAVEVVRTGGQMLLEIIAP